MYPTIQTAHYYTVFPLYNPALGDAFSAAIQTRSCGWADIGDGAWVFWKHDRRSGERQGQEEHVCGDTDEEVVGHAG